MDFEFAESGASSPVVSDHAVAPLSLSMQSERLTEPAEVPAWDDELAPPGVTVRDFLRPQSGGAGPIQASRDARDFHGETRRDRRVPEKWLAC